jgi:hypothetical protein
MRKLHILLIILTFYSCDKNIITKEKFQLLQEENDSLKGIIKDYKDKYVYDFVLLRQAPKQNNSFKKGSNYKGELMFVTTNKEDYILFGTEIKNTDIGGEILNPDTLKISNGVYSFETKLKSDTTKVYFKPLIQNKIALDHMNSFYNRSSFSDEIIVEKR